MVISIDLIVQIIPVVLDILVLLFFITTKENTPGPVKITWG